MAITSDRNLFVGVHVTPDVKKALTASAERQKISVSLLLHRAATQALQVPRLKTFTGKFVDPLALLPGDICIQDIAHHLACINRFGGASRFPITVAQHSVYVARLCPAPYGLHGLLHDASEAYLGDIPRPLKHSDAFAGYREIEHRVQELIYTTLGSKNLVLDLPTLHEADNLMLKFEATIAHSLTLNGALTAEEKARIGQWEPWGWQRSEQAFLNLYTELTA
jgi:hypothetical protein